MSRVLVLVAFAAAAAAAADNLVANGDFAKADASDATRPDGWDKPDGLGVQWVDSGDAAHGRIIRIDTAVSEEAMVAQWKKVGITDWNIPKPAKDPVAATYGLSFYSKAFPVAKGKAYRVTVAYRGSGGAKVWVRGYGDLHGEKRRIYEAQGDCPNSPKQWGMFTQVFHPTKRTPGVTEMKVMLYAFWPPGVSEFDEVKVEELDEEAGKQPEAEGR